MRDIEQNPARDDSVVETAHEKQQAEPELTPVQKDITTTGRQKLPRAWQYAIIGGTVLLVLAVIFAGVLFSGKQAVNPTSHTRSTPATSSSPLATSPATTPIPGPALSDHTVSVAIANGVAYLGTMDNAVYALRISDGSVLWRHKIEGSVGTQPLVDNGVVYVTSFVGQIGPAYAYALRASDGSLLWRHTYSDYSYLYLSTTDRNVAFVNSLGEISALNTSNGSLLWHFATDGTVSWWLQEVNGVIYVSSSINNASGTLYALRVSNGTPLWKYTTDGFIEPPAMANGVIYIDSSDGTLAALRASDGHQLWKQAIDANLVQQPQLVNGILYTTATKITLPSATGNANPLQGMTGIGALLWNTLQSAPAVQTIPHKQGLSSVYAVRASDGATLWHYTMNKGANSWANWFSVENGVVYASAANAEGDTGTGDIYALQSGNGSVLWHDKLNASPSGAVLANGVIYLGASTSTSSGLNGGVVYAVRASDGSQLWNYPIAGTIFNAPVLDGNVVYVGAGNGMAYALRADTGALLWHYLTQVGG
jgi:outer membrane protein assembly factor BamB